MLSIIFIWSSSHLVSHMFVVIVQSYKYQEEYQKALEEFHMAGQLDPSWNDPGVEEKAILTYLDNVVTLSHRRVGATMV